MSDADPLDEGMDCPDALEARLMADVESHDAAFGISDAPPQVPPEIPDADIPY